MRLLLSVPKMLIFSRIKIFIFPVFLLLWLFFIPLATVIYTPWTYQVNCYWNLRCEQLGLSEVDNSSLELASFFRHQLAALPSPPWSSKEIQHLTEVRGMYDQIFWLFIIITAIFALDLLLNKRPQAYQSYAKMSRHIMLGLLLAMLLISPFFKFFWMEIFHPFVFNNQLWLTNQLDISWYLMPRNYFLWVIFFLFSSTLLLNQLLIFWLAKNKAILK